jgi:hypothetical protein
MKYLIKSLKWTRHYNEDTWYRPNSNGYTNLICGAGIYTEEDKEVKKDVIGKDIAFVPLKKELINQGKHQIQNLIRESNEIIKMHKDIIKEHKQNLKVLDDMKGMI